MSRLFFKLRSLFRRDAREADLRDELQFHLDEEVELRRSAGAAPHEAVAAARRDLGNFAAVQESARAAWTWTWVEQLAQDLRYGLRAMLGAPAFTALSLLSLALGIGANTAIYSFMDAILLRALPVPDTQSLALLNWHSPPPRGPKPNHVMHSMDGTTWGDDASGDTSGIFPYGVFELFQKDQSAFSVLFAYCGAGERNLTVDGRAEIAAGEFVSGDYFRGVGLPPAAGRLLLPDDDRAAASPVVVLSNRFARRRFGDPAAAVGRSILVDNLPFTVVGVTAPGFFGVDPGAHPDYYVPMRMNLVLDRSASWAKTEQTYLNQNYYWVEMMGRLRPGVTLAHAQAILAPRFHQWVLPTAKNEGEIASLPALTLQPGARGLGTLRRRYSEPLYVLLAMVGLILAIACANIANLLLSRASARRREIAVRLSIGAGRGRLVRQLLTESILLAVAGGVLGVALAFWGIRLLTFLLANGDADFLVRPSLNWRVLAAASALSVLCGAIFGLAPALQSTRSSFVPALKEGRVSEPGGRRRFAFVRLGHSLVVAQIVFSLLMLVAAGLFVRTLATLQSVPMGFNRENVLLFELNARQAGHRDPELLSFYADLRSRFAAIPGVRAVTLAHTSLIRAGRGLDLKVDGAQVARETRLLNTGPGFFSTMQIPILLGREIDDRDGPASPGVVVVSQRFVKKHYGDINPLGRRIRLGGPHPREMEIVGVAADAHYGSVRDDIRPIVYIPYNQGDYPRMQAMTYAVRTAGDPLVPVNTVREIVRQADSRIPLAKVQTQAAEIDADINQEIVFARLCTAFAVLALVISVVGLYGTMTYAVARRTPEIGIRMALGAQRSAVMRMVLGRVLALSIAGLAIGLPAALAGSRLVEAFMFRVKPNDPLAVASAAAILLAAALLAGGVPARRASRIDPIVALRHE